MNKISTKYIMHNIHVNQSCTSTDIIHGMYPPYANMCIYQYANMCIYHLCQPCASINMPNKYHLWVYHHASSLAPSKYINHASTRYDSQCCTTWLSTQLTNYMSQYVAQPHAKCMHHDIQHMLPIIHHKIYQWNSNMYQPCTPTDQHQSILMG